MVQVLEARRAKILKSVSLTPVYKNEFVSQHTLAVTSQEWDWYSLGNHYEQMDFLVCFNLVQLLLSVLILSCLWPAGTEQESASKPTARISSLGVCCIPSVFYAYLRYFLLQTSSQSFLPEPGFPGTKYV